MNLRRYFLLAATVAAISGAMLAGNASAQQPVDNRPVFDPAAPAAHESAARQSKPTVAELRQARALYRANQRVARMEYNLWMGREPLRPRWNSIPMMSTRYSASKFYVPVYVYPTR